MLPTIGGWFQSVRFRAVGRQANGASWLCFLLRFTFPIIQTTYTFGIAVFKVRIQIFAVIITSTMRHAARILFHASTIDSIVKFYQAIFWHFVWVGKTLTRNFQCVVEMELVGLPATDAREILVHPLSEDLPIVLVIPRFSDAARDIRDFLNLPITSLGFVEMQ